MDILFLNGTLLPMTAEGDAPRVMQGALGITENRIALLTDDEQRIEAFRQAHPQLREIDCHGKLLMPGLINTHCHAAMTLQRSNADDIALMEWLNDYIWPFEAHQTPEDARVGMELAIVEMLLGGTTSFVDMYYYENHCVETVRKMGIRAMLGCNYFDHNVDQVMEEMADACQRAKDCSRIQIAAAPHAPYTCSRENILRGKEFCRQHGLHFMTHIAETKDEDRIIREKWGMSPVKYLDKLGVLDDQTIGAHCIHVDQEDIDILAKRGVAVSHNPQSNMKISSGICPVEQLRKSGALVTIATDGTCSNNDLDLFEELRTAVFLQKVSTQSPLSLPAYEALKMVTVNGARALGYQNGELGVLKEGALADVIVIDLEKPHLKPVHNLIGNLVYAGKASDVDTVVVDGQILVEHREVVGVNLEELFARATQTMQRIVSQMHA